MRIQNPFFKSFITFSLSLLIIPIWEASAAETYSVDAGHSSVIFRAKHYGATNFYGRFNELSGSLTLDTDDPTKSSIELEVRAESVDTFSERRDRHLRSPDFFNAKQFPVISFKSKSVKALEDDTYELTGDFSLHGVTKTLTVKAKQTGAGKTRRGNSLVGFETTFTIKRSDFGMTYMLDSLSDEVKLIISLEGVNR